MTGTSPCYRFAQPRNTAVDPIRTSFGVIRQFFDQSHRRTGRALRLASSQGLTWSTAPCANARTLSPSIHNCPPDKLSDAERQAALVVNALTRGASVTDVQRVLASVQPALHGACGQPDDGAGPVQSGAGAAMQTWRISCSAVARCASVLICPRPPISGPRPETFFEGPAKRRPRPARGPCGASRFAVAAERRADINYARFIQ